jgi:hypothetical protein
MSKDGVVYQRSDGLIVCSCASTESLAPSLHESRNGHGILVPEVRPTLLDVFGLIKRRGP